MFRMSRPCFQLLCERITSKVGEKKFKSEKYIDAFLIQPDNPFKSRVAMMHNAHANTSGGYVCGEVKLAITLRLMAGGDALDLGALFDISPNWCKHIFYDVLTEWVLDINLGEMDVRGYLSNKDELDRVSNGFSVRSNGVLKGAIGAIDGWLVKIVKPNSISDRVNNIVGVFF